MYNTCISPNTPLNSLHTPYITPQLTDPYNTRHITFSDCVSVLSSELVGMMAPEKRITNQ